MGCCSDCEGNVTLGCLVSDFFPEPATVSWVSKMPADVETFPAVQGSNSYYSLSTQLTLPARNLKGNNFQCTVNYGNRGNPITEVINGNDYCCINPTVEVKLLSDLNKYEKENKVLLMCLIEGVKAGQAQVQWLQNHEVANLNPVNSACTQCADNKAAFISQVNVSRQSWDLGAEFSCKVTHPVLKQAAVYNISTFCKDTQKVEVTLLPPTLEELYLTQNASVTCVVTNVKSSEDVKFAWSRDSGRALDVTKGTPEKLENGLYRLTSTLKICADEWNSGETFSCSVTIPEIEQTIKKSIKKDIAVSVQAPSVYVFPPPAEELARQETATLTCLALGFRPRDILVTWTQEDRPVAASSYSTFGPQQDGDTFTVYSKLSVPAADWQRGDYFSCVVGHDGFAMKFVQKTLDKSIGKPNNVNVSVVLADADVTCY